MMLSVLIVVPLVAAAGLGLWPGRLEAQQVKRGVGITTLGLLVWTALAAGRVDVLSPDGQLLETLPWLSTLGLHYQLGLDGLSLPLVALNSLLTVLVVYSSPIPPTRPRLYYSLLLLIQAGVAGAFLAQNLLLFFLFYELELIPLYLLIAIWGGERRGYAATKFLIYTALSGLLLLVAFFGMAILGGGGSFSLGDLDTQHLPLVTQVILLVILLVALGIKIPLVPFHTWLPDAHVEASTPVSMLLAGILLKLGTYGLLRFGLALLPAAWQVLAPGLAIWAVVSVLYGSLMAILQQDMKRIVAYSSIGHMGYVLLGAAAATPLSLLGAVCQMVSHGLISALLFYLVGLVYRKTGSRNLNDLQGLLLPDGGLPLVGTLMILAVMASSGIPGMVGFITEFLIFRGSFPGFPLATLACMIGTGLASVYFLLLVNRAFFGRLTARLAHLPLVAPWEYGPAGVLALLVVVLGIQPSWLSRWSEVTTTALSHAAATASILSADLSLPWHL